MLLTSGVVFVSVLILSFVVFQQFRSVILDKTYSVCRNLSINISNLAREELLINEIYEGTRNAVSRLRPKKKGKNPVTGLLNTYVINSYGIITAHTNAAMIDKPADKSDLQSFNNIKELTLSDIEINNRPVLRFAYPIFIIYQKKPLRVGTGVFEFDKGDIYRPVEDMRFYVLVVSLALLLIAIVVTFFFALRLSHPIEKLATAASDIADGNLGIQVNIQSGGGNRSACRNF